MAVWGIGAYYDSDKSDDFINNNVACIGWDEKSAPALHKMISSIKMGDIIYIKSYVTQKQQLLIKAIGIVTSTAISNPNDSNLGMGVTVKWDKRFSPYTFDITKAMYRNNVFNNSLYEEFNSDIIQFLTNNLIP